MRGNSQGVASPELQAVYRADERLRRSDNSRARVPSDVSRPILQRRLQVCSWKPNDSVPLSPGAIELPSGLRSTSPAFTSARADEGYAGTAELTQASSPLHATRMPAERVSDESAMTPMQEETRDLCKLDFAGLRLCRLEGLEAIVLHGLLDVLVEVGCVRYLSERPGLETMYGAASCAIPSVINVCTTSGD